MVQYKEELRKYMAGTSGTPALTNLNRPKKLRTAYIFFCKVCAPSPHPHATHLIWFANKHKQTKQHSVRVTGHASLVAKTTCNWWLLLSPLPLCM